MPLPHLLQVLEQSPLSTEQGTDLGRILQQGQPVLQGPGHSLSLLRVYLPEDTVALFLLERLTTSPGPSSVWTLSDTLSLSPVHLGFWIPPLLKSLPLRVMGFLPLSEVVLPLKEAEAQSSLLPTAPLSPTPTAGHSPGWGQCRATLNA